jgi:Dna[CI] antecedent, DciA
MRQPGSAVLVEHRLRLVFREVIGEALAGSCESIEVQRSTVFVTTSNPALAHQLRLDSERLMERLNQESNLPRRVRAIRVRVGTSGPRLARGGPGQAR